jgi:valyl-tRNA synthetase
MMRYDVRVKIEKVLKERRDLLRGKEGGLCSRSGDMMESMLTPQRYANCVSMARCSVDAVRDGHLKIVPAIHEVCGTCGLDTIRDCYISP